MQQWSGKVLPRPAAPPQGVHAYPSTGHEMSCIFHLLRPCFLPAPGYP